MDESGIAFTIGAVAHQLGVAVPTLRSWDRRYGLGPSEHISGKHRRYTSDDLVRLRRMLTLTGEGVPPAVAAELVIEAPRQAPEPVRDGGGSGALAVGRVDRAVRGLARAAARFDVLTLRSRVEHHLAQHGVWRAWDELLVPLLRTIGEKFDQDPEGTIAVEHVASAGILAALHGIPPVPEQGRLPALLACAPEEQHSLPLEALQASLAEQRCPSRFLGPRMPAETLISAVNRVDPRSVVLWSHSTRTARKVDMIRLAERCRRVVLAGPGWSNVRAAHHHARPDSLGDAIRIITETSPTP